MPVISDAEGTGVVSAHRQERELAPDSRCLFLVNEVSMFDQTFVEAAPHDKKPATVAFSLALQGAVICLLILIRLVYTESLPGAAIKSFLIAPAPPQMVVPEHFAPKTQPKLMTRTFDPRKFFAPVVIPKTIPSSVPSTPTPDVGVAGSTGEANGSTASGVIGSILGAVPRTPVAPPGEARPKNQSARKPVSVGSILAEANLIRRVMPVYPPLARSARVQGAVEFTALISKEGRIENLQLVHGHPLLVNAAKEAVLQWKYRPTTLNGEAVEVITDIVVNFTLAQ